MCELKYSELTESNCGEAVDIYNYYVLETTVSYNTEPVSVTEFVNYYQLENPLTIAYNILCHDRIAGFCILKPWNAKKQAYRQTYEFTIYISKEVCHKGFGSKAFRFMEEKAMERNLVVIMAGLSADNVSSCKMLESVGFTQCGFLQKVGNKFGKFLDLYYYQKVYTENMETTQQA